MITRRRFVTRTSGSIATVLLAACASPQPPGQTGSGASTPAAPTPVGAPAATTAPATASNAAGKLQHKLDLGGYKGPTPTGQTVKLRVMRQVYPPASDQWWKDMYAQWGQAYPHITIDEEIVPYGDLYQKLQTYVAAGDPPDIMMGRGDFVPAYEFNGIALNLTDYLTDEFLNDIAPAVRAQQSVNGKLYAMPWEQQEVLFFFNKELFAKTGIPTPPETTDLSKAWTWDQFGDMWKKISAALNPPGDPDVYALAASEYGSGGPGSSYWYEGMYTRSMGDANAPKDSSLYRTFAGVSQDGTRASGYVDTPEAIKGMQFYQSIFQQKFSPSVPVRGLFEGQKAATRFGGIGHVIRFTNPETGIKFKWGCSPIPRGNMFFNHISADSPIVAAKSKHPSEAVAFLAFIHNDKNRVSWIGAWGAQPARQSLFDMVPVYKQYPYDLAVATKKVGHPPPITPGYLEYFSAMNTAVKDIALGANVEERLKKVAKDLDDLLARYKR